MFLDVSVDLDLFFLFREWTGLGELSDTTRWLLAVILA